MKRISVYDSALELLKEEAQELIDMMTEEAQEAISAQDDYDSFKYYVIDRKVVITDGLTDDVIGSYKTVFQFFCSALEACIENN